MLPLPRQGTSKNLRLARYLAVGALAALRGRYPGYPDRLQRASSSVTSHSMTQPELVLYTRSVVARMVRSGLGLGVERGRAPSSLRRSGDVPAFGNVLPWFALEGSSSGELHSRQAFDLFGVASEFLRLDPYFVALVRPKPYW